MCVGAGGCVCGGVDSCTDAVAFKGRMGNSEMQMGQILIAPISLLETLFTLKGKERLGPHDV